MTLFDIIQAAINENFARESVVTLQDGRQIVTAADPEAVADLAREIEAAVRLLSVHCAPRESSDEPLLPLEQGQGVAVSHFGHARCA